LTFSSIRTQRSRIILSLINAIRSFRVGKHGLSLSSSWSLKINELILIKFVNTKLTNRKNKTTKHRENLRTMRNESYRFTSRWPSTKQFFFLILSEKRRKRKQKTECRAWMNSLFQVTDRPFRFSFDELHESFMQIMKMPITFVDRPFERTVFCCYTISEITNFLRRKQSIEKKNTYKYGFRNSVKPA